MKEERATNDKSIDLLFRPIESVRPQLVVAVWNFRSGRAANSISESHAMSEKNTKPNCAELVAQIRKHKHDGQIDLAIIIIREIYHSRLRCPNAYNELKWNQRTVRNIFKEFVAVSRSVDGNSRTVYTEAGGKKIGRAIDDPERHWIDTYTAIKARGVNITFVCYIKEPGDNPRFEIQEQGDVLSEYSADGLAIALADWKKQAERARA